MTPLLGFTPDAPTTTPGILVDCDQFIPYESGMKSAPSAVAQGAAALGDATRGAATETYLDGTKRVFVGTVSKLYDLSGTTFTDRSRGAGYTLGTDTRWQFAQFGAATYASNIDTVVQKSTSGAFADVSGAPKARILFPFLTSGGGFLIALNTIDGGFGTSQDRWWNSGVNNGDDWTIDPTGALGNSGRLLGAEGPITAGAQLGTDLAVAYKDRSIYVGTFVGTPSVFQWREVPGIGCVGPDALVSLGTAHLFVGQDNIYLFDGSRPIPLATGQVRQWFLDNSDPNFRYATKCVYDRDANLIWIFFPSASSGSSVCNRGLVYHLGSKQWGRADRTIETAMIYATPSVTIDGLGSTLIDSLSGTIDGLAGGAGTRVLALFDSTHTMQLMTGSSAASSMTLGDVGDDDLVTTVNEMSLRYMQQPTSAAISAFYAFGTGGVPSVGPSQSAFNVPSSAGNKFKIRQTANWHRFQFSFVGNVKVTGYNIPQSHPAGTR